ncbi:hypothetical protein DL767_009283 [Monosporascus sp. MG133]|nr:hypothetical protein DL767_009283 [Monosporascus sp. MG133]
MTIAILGRPLPLISRFPRVFLRSIGTEQHSRRDSGPRRPPDGQAFGGVDDGGMFVQPGEHVISWCREHDIAFPNQMKGLKARLPKNPLRLGVFFSRRHCIDNKSMRYFDKAEHPFARSMFDVYVAKKKAPLWYDSWCTPNARPFVISTARRRIKHALRDALAARGYDRDGRRTDNDPEETVVMDLFGTLKIHSPEPKMVCNTEFAELVEQMSRIVGVAELELRRGKDGRHLATLSAPYQHDRGSPPYQHNKRGPAPGDKNQRFDQAAKPPPSRGPAVTFRKHF